MNVNRVLIHVVYADRGLMKGGDRHSISSWFGYNNYFWCGPGTLGGYHSSKRHLTAKLKKALKSPEKIYQKCYQSRLVLMSPYVPFEFLSGVGFECKYQLIFANGTSSLADAAWHISSVAYLKFHWPWGASDKSYGHLASKTEVNDLEFCLFFYFLFSFMPLNL